MLETLLHTKLLIPSLRPNLVPRPQLIERLNYGLQLGHKLTLVSAPAGFGKTTLVSEWVNGLGQDFDGVGEDDNRIAWLSLDEGDNDLSRFLTYFIAALNGFEGNADTIGEGVLSMLQSPQPAGAVPVLTMLINDITAVSERIILILDDYHLIESPPVDDALTFMLDHLPPQMHLVIATRSDPNLPLPRLRARGQLAELRAIDLRFSSSEAADFLNEVMGLALPAEEISALENRTEGWIVGLQLAALSMQGKKDTAVLIKSFTGSHRFILDYLIEEVLEQQPETVQVFLLKTSVLNQLTGSLCDALTGQVNGQAMLEMMESANMFITPLDEERRWYRYHHLFADLLRQRLRQTQSDEIPVLHIKAGEWFNQQGMKREAIKHSLPGRNYQGAADMIKSIAIDIMQQGEHTTVVGWINTIPDELIKEQPYLCVLHAWALQLAGQLETAEARLIDGEKALDSLKSQDDEDHDVILGLINFRRAYSNFMVGELDRTIFYAKQALDQLPETAALIRAHTVLYLGVAYRYQGQLQEALDTYNEILPFIERMGGKSIAVLYYIHLSDVYWQMAQLHHAKELCEQALTLTEQYKGRPDMPFCGFAYVRIGRILRQWNQLQKSYQFTTKGLALCRDWNVADILALSHIELAYICWALGNDEQARASIQEAIQIMDSFSPWGSKIAAAHQAKMELAHGDIGAAERWAQSNELSIDGEFEFDREIDYLTMVRVFIAQKRIEEAHSLATRIYKIALEIGKRQTVLETQILLALLFFAKDDSDQALVHLEKALTIAQPEGFTRIFVDEGPPMARLLLKAFNNGIAPDYVHRLLAAFSSEEPPQAYTSSSQLDQSVIVEPLSEREIEVLELIAEGLTNKTIAARLFLSQNTVKVHARNINGKLGVHSRTQAIAKARGLGILS